MSNDQIKQWIAEIAPRRMAADTILLRYQTEPPLLRITLLAYQCCFPAVSIAKRLEEIAQSDVVEAVKPIFEHQH